VTALTLPELRAEVEAAEARLAVVVCEYAWPALALVNVARTDRRFGAGELAQWPDGSPYEMHPVRMALRSCGVEGVFGDGTVDVLEAEAPTLVRAWYPFGAPNASSSRERVEGFVPVPLPADLAIFVIAFDQLAEMRRWLAAYGAGDVELGEKGVA